MKAYGRAYFKMYGMIVILFMIVNINTATAHTATRFFTVDIVDLADKGKVDDISGHVILKNEFKDTAFIVDLRYFELYDVTGKKGLKKSSGKLEFRDELKIPFKFKLVSEGKYRIVLSVDMYESSGKVLVGQQNIELYFRAEGENYTRTTYEDLYLDTGEDDPEPGQPPVAIADTIPVKVGMTSVPLPVGKKAVFGVDKLELHALPAPAGTGDKDTRENSRSAITPGTSGHRHFSYFEHKHQHHHNAHFEKMVFPSLADPLVSVFLPREAHAWSPVPKPREFHIKGKLSYKGDDSNLHSGWNWFVQLWWEKEPDDWVELASQYLDENGEWSVGFKHPLYQGKNLRVLYRAGNEFVMPQMKNGRKYWWKHYQDFTDISENLDVGHSYADTSNTGVVAGLGDIYLSSSLYWSKFLIHGVNPARSLPLRLYFPNISYNCGRDEPEPWSCASPRGEVWLTPGSSKSFTMQHELSHQTNFEFWDNEASLGSAISHFIHLCYNKGLALSEGFANAVPHWVLDGENSASPSAGIYRIESPDIDPPDGVEICNGDTNEARVSAVFWDLLDRHSDDKDTIWFNDPVEVFSLYLGGGVKNGIKDYLQVYQRAANPQHKNIINDIYKQNTISVP